MATKKVTLKKKQLVVYIGYDVAGDYEVDDAKKYLSVWPFVVEVKIPIIEQSFKSVKVN